MLESLLLLITNHFLEFKTDRIRQEWDNENLDKKLKSIICILAIASFLLFQKVITVTDIFRTKDENKEIYRKKGRKPFPSPHMYWRGADIRTKGFKKSEIKILVAIANAVPYDLKRKRFKTAKYGDKLHLDHVHLQVSWK